MPEHPDAEAVIALLGLRPLPREGGWFSETYRGAPLEGPALPAHLTGPHVVKTSIYYLMTPTGFSAMHRLPTDELFHFYAGDPVEQLHLLPNGEGRISRLGTDFATGERPQLLAPAGVWQGSRLAAGWRHGFALLGTTMAPGYSNADYEHGDRAALIAAWPTWAQEITALTRDADGRGA